MRWVHTNLMNSKPQVSPVLLAVPVPHLSFGLNMLSLPDLVGCHQIWSVELSVVFSVCVCSSLQDFCSCFLRQGLPPNPPAED